MNHHKDMTLRDFLAFNTPMPEDGIWPQIAKALMGSDPPKYRNPKTYEIDTDKSFESLQWWSEARARYQFMKADAFLKARKETKP